MILNVFLKLGLMIVCVFSKKGLFKLEFLFYFH